MMRIILLCLLLAGCASPPQIIQREVDGVKYMLYIDADETPCQWRNGACAHAVAGEHRIYMPSFAHYGTLYHEEAHIRGMKHGPWESRQEFGGSQVTCAVVTVQPVGKYAARYPVGAEICVEKHGEVVRYGTVVAK